MYIKDSILFNNRYYSFVPHQGYLYCTNEPIKGQSLNKIDEYKYVENPFLLTERKPNQVKHFNFLVKFYANLLIWLCTHYYHWAYLLSFLRIPLFEDAGEANMAFRMSTKRQQNLLCLPRSIFIATTSKRFKKHGVMFIGCFFPSRHMHAWVIEDGMQADIYDRYWIMYTPVVLMK